MTENVSPKPKKSDAAISDNALLLKAITEGNNKLAQQMLLQSLIIDDSWIDNIENALFSVEQIVKKPKTFIKDDRELVTVEKARRVDSVSIRHLASHTQNVRRINENGRIQPSKVLAKFSDEELATYENRLVYTLIQRLKFFVENKYQAIKSYIACYDITKMNVSTAFKAGKSNVKANLSIAVTVPATGESVSKNEIVLQRLTNVRERLLIILGSDFCTKMQSSKPVRPPIMKTNMLRGNVDYSNCYNLWLFISSFTSVGYSVEVSDKMLPFDDDYFDDLAKVMADSVSVMLTNNNLRREIFDNIPMGETRCRKYKVSRDIGLSNEVPEADLFGDDGAISQFYYDSIRRLTKQIAAESTANDWDNELKVNPNFRRFFKGLQMINQSLYIDVLKLGSPIDNVQPKGRIEKARRALKAQQDEVAKENIIIKLKKEDLALAEKRKEKQLEKMRKLDRELVREIARAERAAEEKRKKDELAKKRKAREKQRLLEKKRLEALAIKEKQEKAKQDKAKRKQLAAERAKFEAEQRILRQKSREKQQLLRAAEKERAAKQAEKERAALKAKKAKDRAEAAEKARREKQKLREKQKSDKLKAQAIAKIKARREKERAQMKEIKAKAALKDNG